jgi:hypothetical protein
MPSYVDELNQLTTLAMDTLVEHLQFFGEKAKEDPKYNSVQAQLTLELVNTMLSYIEMTQSSAVLVLKLIRLASKNPSVDQTYLKSTIDHVSLRKGQWYRTIKENLVGQV